MENESQETQENQNQAPTGEDIETVKAQLADEQKAKAALEEAAAEKDARIAALETALSEAKQESEARGTQLVDRDAELKALMQVREQAIPKYLQAVKAVNPQVPEGIIAGETIEEIDASVEKAKATVEAVKQSLQAEAAATKVPAGAPTRGAISLEGMSPREKIAYAIQQKGGM